MQADKITFNSIEYLALKSRLSKELHYTLIHYPGSNTPRLKIINPDGLTIVYADYETVIKLAQNALDNLDKH